MATLEKREQSPGNVTYRVRWWADGKQRSKSFKNYADARRWRAVLEGDLVNGSYIDPKEGTTTLQSFINQQRHTLLMNLRPSTLVRVEGIYEKHIIPEFGHLPLTAITTPLVSAWVQVQMQTLSAGSVRKHANILGKVLDLAVSHGLLRANSVAPVTLPAEVKREQRFLTHSQAWDLAESMHPRFKALVALAVFGGMRFGELCALRRKHLVIERNQVVIKETLVDVGEISFGPPKTKTSIRSVTIPRSIMTMLVEHMDNYVDEGPEALLFTGQRGVVIRKSWFHRYYWTPAIKQAGLEGLRFHDLRHTFVALWIDLGRNPKEVSKAAGHSSVAFTLDRYGHLYDIDHAELADELDALLGSASGLARTHDTGQTGQNVQQSHWPPSSSGLGRRPFTAVARDSNVSQTRRSDSQTPSQSAKTTQEQDTTGHTLEGED